MTVTFTFDRPSHVSQDKVEQHQNALPWLRGGKVALVTPHPHELQVELVSMTTGNKIWCLLIPRYPPFAVENVPYFVQKSMQAHFCRSDRASQGLAKFTKKCKKTFIRSALDERSLSKVEKFTHSIFLKSTPLVSFHPSILSQVAYALIKGENASILALNPFKYSLDHSTIEVTQESVQRSRSTKNNLLTPMTSAAMTHRRVFGMWMLITKKCVNMIFWVN